MDKVFRGNARGLVGELQFTVTAPGHLEAEALAKKCIRQLGWDGVFTRVYTYPEPLGG